MAGRGAVEAPEVGVLPEILWTSPRAGTVKRLTFLAAVAAGASVLLVCADPEDEGRIRAYRAEECRVVLP
jgi:hypothetical protein